MKWHEWLAQLEQLPSDAPEWDDYPNFISVVEQLGAAKLRERADTSAALEKVLSRLQHDYNSSLARFGQSALVAAATENSATAHAARIVKLVKQLCTVLDSFEESSEKIPASPDEYQELRRTRNTQEDEILSLCAGLGRIFSGAEEIEETDEIEENIPKVSEALATLQAVALETVASGNVALKIAAQPLAAPQNLETASDSAPNPEPEPQLTLEPKIQPDSHPNLQLSTAQNEPVVDAQTSKQEFSNGTAKHPPAPHSHHATLEIFDVTADNKINVLEFEVDDLESNAAIPSGAALIEHTGEQISALIETPSPATPATEAAPTSAPDLLETNSAPTAVIEKSAAPTSASENQNDNAIAGEIVVRKLKIFISSPGDVGQERLIAQRVVGRLQHEFSAFMELEPILWEHEPLRATSHFQDQIAAPSMADIVICILWSRLGTRLPAHFHRADGSLYDSGTEWEFEDALAAYKERGTPDLIVYRKSAEPHASMSDEEALLQKLGQKRALDTFIDRWFGNPHESFKAAFHQFPSPDAFEELLENHLRRLIRDRLPQHVTEDGEAAVSVRWHKGSPFRGLEAFDFEHAPIFFGRTRAIGEIRERLAMQAHHNRAFLLVFGMSGSGKSSLVRAGVLPTITHPGIVEGVALWRWGIMRPTDARDPILALALALHSDEALPELQSRGLDAKELADLLRDAPQSALGPLRAALQGFAEATAGREKLSTVPNARLAIVIDQFEEIFTHDSVDATMRSQFITALSVLARSGFVWILGTMRSDFFARCAEIPELMALKEGSGQYHLLPPNFAELSQMLVQPARAAGLRFEIAADTGNRLSDVLQEAAGKNPGALPLLQFTLDELFKRRTDKGVLTFAAYEDLGGLEGALSQRAEEVFAALPLEVQGELPFVLRALVTVSEERDVKVGARRAPLDTIATNETRRQLVEAFIAARLLVSDEAETEEESESVLRVAHEALLRHWPRVQHWLVEDMEFLRARGRVMSQAARWADENRRPEYLLREGRPLIEGQDLLARRREDLEPASVEYIEISSRGARRARRKRVGIISGVVATFFGVVSGFGAFSYAQWQETEGQKQISERQKVMAMEALDQWTYKVPEKLARIPGARPIISTIFSENIKLLDGIIALNPDADAAQREKASNLQKVGDTWLDLNDTAAAKKAYDDSFAIIEKRAAKKNDDKSRRDLATSLEKVGDIRQRINELPQAKIAYERSLALRRALAESDSDRVLQREISVSYERVGEVRLALKDSSGGFAAFEESLKIRKTLATDKTNKQASHDLLGIALKMGDAYLDRGQKDKAGQTFEQCLQIAKSSQRAGDDEAARHLSAVYDRLGDLQLENGKIVEALQRYESSLLIAQKLAKTQKTAEAAHDLMGSYDRIGSVYLAQGKPAEALGYFAKSLPLCESLAEDEANLLAQQELLESYVKIGDAQLNLTNLVPARRAYWRATEKYAAMEKRWPHDERSKLQAASAFGQIAYIDLLFHNAKQALGEATKALILAPDQTWIAVNLVHAYVFNGRVDKAIQLCRRHAKSDVGGTPFRQVVLDDFKQFDARGLKAPGMDALRQWFAQNP